MQVVLRGVAAVCLLASLAYAQPRRPARMEPQTPVRTAVVDGKSVSYIVQDGQAVTEGDILLGAPPDPKNPARAAALLAYASGQAPLWPEGIMYYSISPSFPNQQRLLDAIEHWNSRTPLKVLPRTGQTNFVQFTPAAQGFCASNVGMIGGQQSILLGTNCPTSAVIHEIGHAFGLLHEQSRKDRNAFLTVVHENLDPLNFAQFDQPASTRDQGYYDYGSIMHYSNDGFSLDGFAALETVPAGIPIGQRTGLSAGDIDGISRIYGATPSQTIVSTIPEGLTIIVDGERYTSPRSFAWGPGTTHTISTEATQNTGSSASPARNRFLRWTDGGGATHTFTADPAQTAVTAIFQQSFRVTTSVAGGTGTVTVDPPSADGYYTAGTRVKISAVAGGGQTFYRWGGNNPEFFGYGLAAPSMTIDVRMPLSFSATFTSEPMVSVESTPPGAEIDVDGVPYYTPVKFQSFVTGSSHTLGVRGPQYDPAGSSRKQFAGWDDGSLSTLRTIPAGAAVYTARFTTQNPLRADWTNDGSLAFSPDPFDGYFDADSAVTVTAVPRPNRVLQFWIGDAVSGASTQTIPMDRPKFLLGVFGPPLELRATNAASYSSSPIFDQPALAVAPLEIVTLFGRGLGPAALITAELDQSGRVSTLLGGTRVLFDGVPAPIIYASDTQTSVVVPVEVAGRVFTVITVERGGAVSAIGTATIVQALPGIFTANASGTGPVAALNQDYSVNSPGNPAARGSVVTLFTTGSGLMDRSLPNGAVTGVDLLRPQLPVSVRIGTETAQVEYAGSAPSLVHGVLQVNVRIPANVQPGSLPVKLVVGGWASPPGTTVSVR